MLDSHTEVPATPDTTHLYALASAARDGGVCVDFEPVGNPHLDELVQQAQRWGMYD